MINIAGNDIIDIAIGSTPIEKVYIGSQLVWEKNVPTIEDADGNVYKIRNYINIQMGVRECNLGIYPIFPSDGYEAKITFASSNRQYVFGGGYNNGNSNLLGINVVSGLLRTRYHNVTLSSGYDVRNKTLVVSAMPNTDTNLFEVKIDGTVYNTNALITRTPGTIRNFYIGRFYNMTDYGAVNGNKIWWLKYYRNGTAVRDLIPVEDEDGVYAFFDKTNLKAYYSSGSSPFTGG